MIIAGPGADDSELYLEIPPPDEPPLHDEATSSRQEGVEAWSPVTEGQHPMESESQLGGEAFVMQYCEARVEFFPDSEDFFNSSEFEKLKPATVGDLVHMALQIKKHTNACYNLIMDRFDYLDQRSYEQGLVLQHIERKLDEQAGFEHKLDQLLAVMNLGKDKKIPGSPLGMTRGDVSDVVDPHKVGGVGSSGARSPVPSS